MSYADFLASKARIHRDEGLHVEPDAIHESLFGFQRAITRWALRKGRAAVFADTGLGKTRIQLEWARLTGQRCLILAPLAVTHQTIAEAALLGIDVRYAHNQSEADGQITISNYERLDRFDTSTFGAVVLDESSILKAFSGVTKKALIKSFAATPYRLACTATPAPNDIEELCNHADFLGIMKPNEMRSTFFIADSRGEFMRYRLKGHAHQAFYRWLSSWAMAVKMPSDLGFDDDGFILPGLIVQGHFVDADYTPEGQLFLTEISGVGDYSRIRRATLPARVDATIAVVEQEPDEPWLIWTGMNAEADAITARIPNAVNVQGSDRPDDKARALLDFAEGRARVLVTKPAIAGFGMNFQRCARMAFVGLGYSYEQYYQALRRCHRFGQTRPVHAHIVLADIERSVIEIVQQKEQQAQQLSAGLMAELRDLEQQEIFVGTSRGDDYEPRTTLTLPDWMVPA